MRIKDNPRHTFSIRDRDTRGGGRKSRGGDVDGDVGWNCVLFANARRRQFSDGIFFRGRPCFRVCHI